MFMALFKNVCLSEADCIDVQDSVPKGIDAVYLFIFSHFLPIRWPIVPYLIQLPLLVVDIPPTNPLPWRPEKIFTNLEADMSSSSRIILDPMIIIPRQKKQCCMQRSY